ncbi:MAG TPA: cytochrome c3 family protein [Candidatus Saccharimonadales bacterium]|nr:cytochrome c3 family protein [Candidatus Saccharimonadales bacterium]
MPQIFHRRSNTIARAGLLAAVLLVIFSGWGLHAVFWSPLVTKVDMPQTQPVMFSHEHHVSGLGIDCRYCHSSVEKSSFAGLPPTETCMTCHSQLWTQAPILQPVRESRTTHAPIRWNRVHDLPDFVFFDHSIHVQKGVGCSSCHGRVDRMPLVSKDQTLYMKWCLECHREPEKFVRAKARVFDMTWKPLADQTVTGTELVRQNHIQTSKLSDCSVCHR